ncbi:MAG: YbaB/EbfC family nucleoid-associated protein [Syntrophomonadaceae bacterium]|nr:YbaB/EbfC family nucleoid-associated protein [Syntrophomonadaceae bacterium]
MKFGDMSKVMKQVQKMQQDLAKLQDSLKEMTVEASSGGGVVKVVCSGKQEVKSIKINPEAIDLEDLEMLEDLVLTAVNEALRKSQELQAEQMSQITGGIKVPGLF